MTTLTVNITNKKTEKALKGILDVLGLDYNIQQHTNQPLTKSDKKIYDRLERSLNEIKLHKEGKIKLRPIEEILAELS